MDRVLVVGVDGSKNSESAFAWAVDDASHHGGRLLVVTAWHRTSPAPAAVEEQRARETVQRVLDAVPHAAVDLETEVAEGPASNVLIAAAADADLLVVGSLGIQAGRRIVLGTVSALCALHAACPVVVVPARWRQRERHVAQDQDPRNVNLGRNSR